MKDTSAVAQGTEQQRPATWGRGAYEQFIETEGIPIHTGVAVQDLRTAEVGTWGRLDAKGAYIRLLGAEDTDNGYLLELDPARSSPPEQHLFEGYFFVLTGRRPSQVSTEAETPNPPP